MGLGGSRVVYSKLLAQWVSVPDTLTALGAPPEGTLWIVRFAAATFGSFAVHVAFSLALQDGDPRLWVCSSPSGGGFAFTARTFFWEGRLVVPAGSTLWGGCTSGDTADVTISGYELTVP